MDNSGRRLNGFLDNEKIPQRKLAELMDIKPQYINKICTGRGNVSKKLAYKLQELIGVSAA